MFYRESNHKHVNSYQNSVRDPLTRFYNRSFFHDVLNQQLVKANPQHPLSVIISDLNHFKRINDNYGHVTGDKMTQFTASVLENHSRVNGAAVRTGGEGFAPLLVSTVEKDALAIAECTRLATNVEQNHLPERMTIGMGLYTTRDRSVSAETCVECADAAMYETKNNGCNRVVVWRHSGD